MAVFPFEEFVAHVVTNYDVQADSVLALYIKIATYLRDNPIIGESTVAGIINKYLEDNPIEGDFYSPLNPPPYPVTSVNGKTGEVTGIYDENNPPPYPVKSVNGKTGAVTGLYDASNPPPYPVSSVDGKTGAVESYAMLGTRKVFGNTDPLVFIDPDGKIGGIHGGVPYYCYSQLFPPPYPKEIEFIDVTLYPDETDVNMRYIVPSTVTKNNIISVVLLEWTTTSWPSYYTFMFSENNGVYGFNIIKFSFYLDVTEKAMLASVYNDDASKGVVVRFYYKK